MPDTTTPYTPWINYKFGVEFELTNDSEIPGSSITERNMRSALTMNPLVQPYLNTRQASYYHSNGNTWDIKTDATCGWEISTRALYMDQNGQNDEMKSALASINGLRPVVDTSCGTHVHFDLSGFSWKDIQKLVMLWTRYEPFFFELQPESRRDNQFCYPLCRSNWSSSLPRSTRWSRARALMTTPSEREFRSQMENFEGTIERRAALNIGSWWRHGRIEVRLHSGTLMYEKIRYWIMLMEALINRVKVSDVPPVKYIELPSPAPSLATEYIGKQLGLVQSRFFPNIHPEATRLMEFLKRRREQFTPGSGTGSPVLQPARPARVVVGVDPARGSGYTTPVPEGYRYITRPDGSVIVSQDIDRLPDR